MRPVPTRRFYAELGNSPDTAPLFLTLKGDRIEWQPDRSAAKPFAHHHDAWDFVYANRLPAVRINCR